MEKNVKKKTKVQIWHHFKKVKTTERSGGRKSNGVYENVKTLWNAAVCVCVCVNCTWTPEPKICTWRNLVFAPTHNRGERAGRNATLGSPLDRVSVGWRGNTSVPGEAVGNLRASNTWGSLYTQYLIISCFLWLSWGREGIFASVICETHTKASSGKGWRYQTVGLFLDKGQKDHWRTRTGKQVFGDV